MTTATDLPAAAADEHRDPVGYALTGEVRWPTMPTLAPLPGEFETSP